MLNALEYIKKITQNPHDYYKDFNQALMNDRFDDTTQLYTIKEQVAYPFTNEYNEIEAWVDLISDDLVNTSKVYSDFIKLIFKDCDHKQNYKGQYYKLNLYKEENDDEELEVDNSEYYICYDRINKLQQTSTTKIVRCNNVLTWRDEYGNIKTMPCYLGTDITSTNNQISKEAIIPNARMIILIQANDYTMNIRKNQRFMFQHSSCFKVEEVNNYMQESGTNGEVTCVKIYIAYSEILPKDNKELNICDYYDNNYVLTLDQEEIEQVKGFNGKINAILKDSKGDIVDLPIKWESSNDKIVTIDNNGNYEIVGEVGDNATITCYMEDNIEVSNKVEIKIVSSYLPDKTIIVTPNDIKSIRQGKSQIFNCGVFVNGERQSDIVTCEGSGASKDCYLITETEEGFIIKNIRTTTVPLLLTFKAEDCEDVNISVTLKGVV